MNHKRALTTAVMLLAACTPEAEEPAPAVNPVEQRMAPIRGMLQEADSTVQASEDRYREIAERAR